MYVGEQRRDVCRSLRRGFCTSCVISVRAKMCDTARVSAHMCACLGVLARICYMCCLCAHLCCLCADTAHIAAYTCSCIFAHCVLQCVAQRISVRIVRMPLRIRRDMRCEQSKGIYAKIYQLYAEISAVSAYAQRYTNMIYELYAEICAIHVRISLRICLRIALCECVYSDTAHVFGICAKTACIFASLRFCAADLCDSAQICDTCCFCACLCCLCADTAHVFGHMRWIAPLAGICICI